MHLVLPSIIPSIFAIVAMTPVETLGCKLRGLLAISLALAGVLLSLGTVSKGLFDRIKGKQGSEWWIATTLILALPAVYILMFET